MNIEVHILDTKVTDLGLSNRTVNALQHANIFNIRDLFSNELSNIKGLGRISKNEIRNLQNLITKTFSGIKNENEYLFKYDGQQKLYSYINKLSEVILTTQNDERLLKIIQLRFGLNGNKEYSLVELGEAFDLTRERVRQLEEFSIELIKKVITGKALYYTLRLPPSIIVESNELFSTLKEAGLVLTENEIVKIIEDHYTSKFQNKFINELRFILTLFDFTKLPSYLFGPSINTINTWILSSSINQELLIKSVNRIRDFLRQNVISINLFDLKIGLNKGQSEKINYDYINYSIPICSEIEKLENDEYQIKFEYFSTIADKAYRILNNKKTPMHINEILKEINHLLAISSSPSKVLIQSLRGEILNDDRFDVVGKSSVYFLKDWSNVSRFSISELIEEFFHKINKGSDLSSIYDYVKSKRPNADKKSVYTILKMDDKFIKTNKNIYELKSWGGKEYKVETIVRIHKAKELILKYFQSTNSTETTLPKLKKFIENGLKIPDSTFYQIVYKLPFLRIEKSGNSRARKVIFSSEGVFDTTNIEKQNPSEKAIESIFNFLNEKDDQVLLKELRDYVINKTKIKKPTFYKLLSEIDEIKKVKIGTQYYVSIFHKTKRIDLIEDVHKIEIFNLSDLELKNELNNIFDVLEPNSIDVAFFRLGKVFENEIKKYLQRLKNNGTIINSNNLSTLSNMITFINQNKLVSNTHHMTILREKRNECAHELLKAEQKSKLLKHAPFYVELFLKYILLFNGLER